MFNNQSRGRTAFSRFVRQLCHILSPGPVPRKFQGQSSRFHQGFIQSRCRRRIILETNVSNRRESRRHGTCRRLLEQKAATKIVRFQAKKE